MSAAFDGIAACPRCGERADILGDVIAPDHDCSAAGRPVTVERCDECTGGYIRAHRGDGHGHFCGCTECEYCSGTSYLATIAQGPPLPLDMAHPYNASPVDLGPFHREGCAGYGYRIPAGTSCACYAPPNATVDELQAARILNDLAIDEHGNLIPTYATPWNNPRE